MNPELWRRAEELFHAALERSPEGRRAFLDMACGEDSELRRLVETLISKDEQAGGFLEETSPADVADTRGVRGSLVGHQYGPYRILSLLGAGGMGEVYRSRDTRLGRDVAVKVLPQEFASDPDRLRRFEQEARAIAALDHANILVLYDVGTHEGAPYIVTQLLEGESLRDRLQTGPLPPRTAVELAVQIAQGLSAAHSKGIVHRDLKPGNVFITKEGHVKILDFGLAKLAAERSLGEAAQATTVAEATQVGARLGTVGYMSPEQVRGQAVDQRSDIFSLGCVLYEMLVGRSPFRKETAADTASAILHEDPAPVAGTGETIEPALQEIVGRCLEKRAEDRFSSAHDVALALRACAGGPETPTAALVRARAAKRRVVGLILVGLALLAVVGTLLVKLRPAGPTVGAAALKKIVVLPFENLGAPADAYFASGMAEEITSRLANVQGLGVISRTSAVEYNHKGKTVKQIGSDLGVDYVLEGAVRWEHGQGRESRVRITPQLIRVADDTHVWADRYDRVLADVFAIQSEVAESAVKAMGVTLLPHEQTRLKEISTNDLEAYDLYLQGMELTNRAVNTEFVEGALQKFQAAADRDPRFAQALAMAASTHLTMYWLHYDHSPERLGKGKELAERAVELRPDLAEPHAALAQYYYHGLLDFSRALDELATARRIQPSNAGVLLLTSLIFTRQGRFVEAAELMSKAVELEPRNPRMLAFFAPSCVRARRYAEADRAFGLAIALSPQWGWPYTFRADLQIKWHGDLDKAQAILDEASRAAVSGEDLAEESRFVALLRRDYQGVFRQLEAQEPQARNDPAKHSDLLLSRGQVQMLMGQGDLARRSYEAARLELEKKIAQDPNDAGLHSSLGIAYAGLGRRADAVREAKLGCDLMPASKDALAALAHLDGLAQVYTMVGRPGEAIAILDDRLARIGSFTVPLLRLDPAWDPLRSDPRFQALLKKYAVKP
jgi:TolB-like protein/Flp pilus assembly protein TadD